MNIKINRGKLERELALRGLTQNQFSLRAGISKNALAKINRGEEVRSDTLGKIARALREIDVLDGADALLQEERTA